MFLSERHGGDLRKNDGTFIAAKKSVAGLRLGTQFTCFTGAKVQILTQKVLLRVGTATTAANMFSEAYANTSSKAYANTIRLPRAVGFLDAGEG